MSFAMAVILSALLSEATLRVTYLNPITSYQEDAPIELGSIFFINSAFEEGILNCKNNLSIFPQVDWRSSVGM
jgi:hypothetical protein